MIKGRYVPLRAGGGRAAKAHLAYLERDGVDGDGSPGRLYGTDDTFSRDAFRAPLDGEQRQFRFIVSPEDGDALNLTEFTRQFMGQVEKDTGRRLIWAAVNHHNTDNPHVHIVVRGVDWDGDDLRIDGRYIGREMRWRAQEIATRELGPRHEFEFSRTRSADIGRERFTEIDRLIAERASPKGIVTLRNLFAAPEQEGSTCLARLQTLRQLKLATDQPAGTWRLADGWKESLARLGEYRDLMDRLQPLVGQKAIGYQVLDPNIPFPTFEGVLVGKGLDDELTGQMFAAVETRSGAGYYIRMSPEAAESLREGAAVRAGVEPEPWLKPSDRIIARFAEENGGLYDPRRHQLELETQYRPWREGDGPAPSERVTANLRRLERLARYRLANRLPDGRWHVAADLVSQLEAREQTHPRHVLRIEPVSVPPREPGQDRGPDAATERAELGRAQAKLLGLSYLSDPPVFRGRVSMSEPAPSGREYVRVVDQARRQFTLLPKPPNAEHLMGRQIVVSRDRNQRLSIQLGPDVSR